MKKSLLALAVSLVAVNAHAYWDTGVDTVNKSNPNDGELMLTIWDPVAQQSYSQDLGVRYSALQNGSALNGQVLNLDPTALSIFGSSVNQSTVNWALVAADSHVKNGTTNAFTGAGFILTAAQGVTPPNPTASTVGGGWNGLNNYSVATQMNNPAVTGNQVVFGSGANGSDVPNGYQTFGDSYFINGRAFQSYLTGSGSLDLWNYKYNNAAGNQSIVVDIGSVSLDFNAKTLTLGTAPTVPVPAAAWLMGSALVGLGSIARRRRSV